MAARAAASRVALPFQPGETGVKEIEKYLISNKEAAIMLGLAASTVVRLGNDGAFPVVRIGSRVLYKVDDLQAYADKLAADDVAHNKR